MDGDIEAPEESAGIDSSNKDELIRALLYLCSENDVALPPGLMNALHSAEDPDKPYFGEEGEVQQPLTPFFSELCKRNKNLDSKELDFFKMVTSVISQIDPTPPKWEARLQDASYTVTMTEQIAPNSDKDSKANKKPFIPTVRNQSPVYKLACCLRGLMKGGKANTHETKEKVLMQGINLRFETGKSYLVLGAPGSGKSLLLKLLANRLRQDKHHVLGGTVSVNGVTPDTEDITWTNLVSYTDQIDRHHPRLTVRETLQFAFDCRSGGTHRLSRMPTDNKQINETVEKLDEESFRVTNIMKGLGLARVQDTFVGDDQNVRGVSGGERKRVTLAEITTIVTAVRCLDEISTGLDAATTYDILNLLTKLMKHMNSVAVVSLLQPPPEVFALFDEVILLDAGRVIYSGPVESVVSHFEGLGYEVPDRMDTADWLQALPTPDGAKFLRQPEDEENAKTHLTHDGFVDAYENSERGKAVIDSLNEPLGDEVNKIPEGEDCKTMYKNSWSKSIKLCFQHEFLLWRRDVYGWRMKIIQDLVMGIVVGTVFWQTTQAGSIMGVLFQTLLYICLGTMQSVSPNIDVRGIVYKYQDNNFFPTWAFVIGKSLAAIPVYTIDAILYGTIVYFFAGLAYDDGASVANFFLFLVIIFFAAYASQMLFSIFSAAIGEKTIAQGVSAVFLIFMVIFSGFTVQPDVIPDYWIWVYWANLFAWMLRALAVNEFQSGKYDQETQDGGTVGENILEQFGFTLGDEAFGFEWTGYGIAFAIGMTIIGVTLTCLALSNLRYETVKSSNDSSSEEEEEEAKEKEGPVINEDDPDANFDLPFKKANLTFKDIHYTVMSSISNEPIELLKGVDGYVAPGKMTALMGSSGAGKTTLMDVLALRKTSGEKEGEIKVNGHLQEELSFRRLTGYVEQFDSQSPQLTVRETIAFSAKLRLNENDPDITEESTLRFVNKILKMLELNQIEHNQIGDAISGGLTFEQRKRLSIAVELASNPSIIFLDEPTSGLDARAASIIMRGLKNIANSGRSICATIHQPAQAIFNSFDSLLLLKRGGEVVYFGDLGMESSMLIKYLESYKSTEKIRPGENPATWMLTTIGAGSKANSEVFDYAGSYADSEQRKNTLTEIEQMESEASDKNHISYDSKYATSRRTQSRAVFKRVMTIYWRSPGYNLARVISATFVGLIIGSIYASERTPSTEAEMNSRVISIFVSTIFIGVSNFNTVLAVFETERNMFYRHKASLMYDQKAIILAFTVAEIPFVLLASGMFLVSFYFLIGFSTEEGKPAIYYLFTTLNLWMWTYLGQMVMSLFRDASTAQGFGSVLVGSTALFCGILIRPQYISSFWVFAYWLFPGHYIMEALITSQYNNDDTEIEASMGSDFWNYLNCTTDLNYPDCTTGSCCGTAEEWVEASFDGWFTFDHIWSTDLTYLIGIILLSRFVTYFALTKLNYLSK